MRTASLAKHHPELEGVFGTLSKSRPRVHGERLQPARTPTDAGKRRRWVTECHPTIGIPALDHPIDDRMSKAKDL